MSIYRRTFKRPDGKTRKSKRFTAEFRHRGQLYRRGGFHDRATAEHWVRTEQLRLSRGEVGMVKPMLAARVLPLIDQYASHLETLKRDDMYVYNTRQRLKKLANEAAWATLTDVTAASFEAWRAGRPTFRNRRIGGKTLNQYLDHAVEFCAWLVKPKALLAVNPLAGVTKQTAPTNHRYRRAATIDELNLLLATCDQSRRVQYLFRLYVPIRRDAVANLRWEDLHLDDERPWGEVGAWHNKTRVVDKFAIRLDLAQLLRRLKSNADATDRVFGELLTVDDLRADLDRAGVAFSDKAGNRRLDFHSFRRTFIKLAKAAGVPLEDAQRALHHRCIATTRKWYDDDQVEQPLTDAVERLPDLTPIRIARTGTEGGNNA
jgi:integrase